MQTDTPLQQTDPQPTPTAQPSPDRKDIYKRFQTIKADRQPRKLDAIFNKHRYFSPSRRLDYFNAGYYRHGHERPFFYDPMHVPLTHISPYKDRKPIRTSHYYQHCRYDMHERWGRQHGDYDYDRYHNYNPYERKTRYDHVYTRPVISYSPYGSQRRENASKNPEAGSGTKAEEKPEATVLSK